jgi:hypothetical protein
MDAYYMRIIQLVNGLCLALLCMNTCLAADRAVEDNAYILAEIPEAEVVGEGTLRWFGIQVYRAKLWAPNGQYVPTQPHALELTYGHDFSAATLAKEGAKQMRKQGVPETKTTEWQPLMQQAFTDVKAGDRLTAIYLNDQSLHFYSNGKRTTSIENLEFTRHFLNIWLGPKTTEPELRRKLLATEH